MTAGYSGTGMRWIIVATWLVAAAVHAAPLDEEIVGADLSMDVRAAGVVGSTVSRARGLDALITNPAGLGGLLESELAASGTYRTTALETALGANTARTSLSGFRLGQAGLVYRTGVGRGLGVGLAFGEVRDLDQRSLVEGRETELNFAGFDILQDRDTRGNVYAFTLGAGLEVAPGVRLGVATNLWDGSRDRTLRFEAQDVQNRDPELDQVRFDDSVTRQISGTRLKFGVEVALVPTLSVGGTVVLPSDLDIREDWQQLSRYRFDRAPDERNAQSGTTDYTLHLPAEYAGGVMVRRHRMQFTGMLRYVDWREAQYAPAPARDVSQTQFARYYEPATEARFGVEWRLSHHTALRGGVAFGSMPLTWMNVTQTPVTLAAGLSTPIGFDLLLDVVYLRTMWERENRGVRESLATDRILLGARTEF